MYDPEGALSTVPAVFSVWLGLHFGHVTTSPLTRTETLRHWAGAAAMLVAGGLALSLGHTPGSQGPASPGGLPLNKQLWTLS